MNEGRVTEARAMVVDLPVETPLELYRRTTLLAAADLYSGTPADFTEARRMAQAIEGSQGDLARATIVYYEFLAAILAGQSLRSLARPDVRGLHLDLRSRLRLWRWSIYPLDWFLAAFAGAYVLLVQMDIHPYPR